MRGKALMLPWALAREGATSKAVEMRLYVSLKESVRKILREMINIEVTHTYTLGMLEKEGALAQGQTEREKSWNRPRCSSPGSRRLLGWCTSSHNIYTFPTWVWLRGLWSKINIYLSSKCLHLKIDKLTYGHIWELGQVIPQRQWSQVIFRFGVTTNVMILIRFFFSLFPLEILNKGNIKTNSWSF